MQPKVILCGSSLFLAGVEASLRDQGELDVERLESTPAQAQIQLSERRPDVVIFDLAAFDAESMLALLTAQPGLRLIGLDLNSNTLVVFSSQQRLAQTTSDLTQLIYQTV